MTSFRMSTKIGLGESCQLVIVFVKHTWHSHLFVWTTTYLLLEPCVFNFLIQFAHFSFVHVCPRYISSFYISWNIESSWIWNSWCCNCWQFAQLYYFDDVTHFCTPKCINLCMWTCVVGRIITRRFWSKIN